MSTNAAIIMKTEGGYMGVYCHWDGYTEHTGRLLVNHYTTPKAVEELISLGALSVLGERANPIGKHSFNTPEKGTTVAYHRDRGDDFQVVTGANLKDVTGCLYCNFIYVFEDGKWTCNGNPMPHLIFDR